MNKKQLRNSILALSFCTMAWMMPNTTVWAATDLIVDANQSQILNMDTGVNRVAIANPSIADVTVTSGQQIIVVAKTVGSTSLYVWDNSGTRYDYNIVVTNQDVSTGAAIQHIIGYPSVKVDKIGGKILLTGKVKDQVQQQRAESIAKMYGSDVVNMITMSDPMQIRIEAKIVEISKNKTKNLGVKWGNAESIDTTTGVVAVSNGSFSFGQDSSNDYWNKPLGGLGGIASINANLNLLISNGDAKVLSRPHVVTMSGQKASILIGGEMPVPSTNSNGSTNTEWKRYGIGLDMEPVADEDGLITSKVKAYVSTLSEAAGTNVNGVQLKGLAERSAETVISLRSGETMVIGGLLSSEDIKNVDKIPLLGDIPLLGAFFRSVSHSQVDRELLILITPTLVDSSTTTRVSEDMKYNLHNITRDELHMPTIPKIHDSNTVIAQDEYPEQDAEAAETEAKAKAKKAAELAEKRADRLERQAEARADEAADAYVSVPASTAGDRANSMRNLDDTSDSYRQAAAAAKQVNNNRVTPVALDRYEANDNNEGSEPGLLKQRLAALRAANRAAQNNN
jgi:pilus assembly protein CpaC